MNEQRLETTNQSSSAQWLPWFLMGVLFIVGVLVYWNSLRVPFLFDDSQHIVENRTIERLWPPGKLLTRGARPVVQISIAVNYALGGRHVLGFHLVNIAIHIIASLLLYGIVRRTYEFASTSGGMTASNGRQQPGEAVWLAFAVALIWLVHPLQTQAVTYIIQRSESLMGLFYLLTLYCVIRVVRCGQGGGAAGWGLGAIAACGLGMGCKPVMVSAPLAALLYDRTFLAGSFASALRKRWGLYVGLAATWVVLFATVGVKRIFRDGSTAGFGAAHTVSWIDYAMSQPGVILHYLRLVLWPHPLCFDHGWPETTDPSQMKVILPALALGIIIAGTVYALRRGSWLGFAGGCFFMILAPSSSIMPIADLAVEHRMYLALAPVVAVLVIMGYTLIKASPFETEGTSVVLLFVISTMFMTVTVRRNRDYRNPATLWATVVRTAPLHYRGHNNFANELLDLAERSKLREDPRWTEYLDGATKHYRTALKLQPDVPEGHGNLGRALTKKNLLDEAIQEFEKALELKPDYAEAFGDLGLAFAMKGNFVEAIRLYRRALELTPKNATTRGNLGAALANEGDLDQALIHFRRAVDLSPDANTHYNLAVALKKAGREVDARRHLQRSNELRGGQRP